MPGGSGRGEQQPGRIPPPSLTDTGPWVRPWSSGRAALLRRPGGSIPAPRWLASGGRVLGTGSAVPQPVLGRRGPSLAIGRA